MIQNTTPSSPRTEPASHEEIDRKLTEIYGVRQEGDIVVLFQTGCAMWGRSELLEQMEPAEGGGENNAIAEMLAGNPEYWPQDAGYDATVGCLDVRRLPIVADDIRHVGFQRP